MTTKTVYLNKEINPEYYKIGEEHIELMEKWNEQNSKMHNLQIPKFFYLKAKKELVQLKKDGEELSSEYIAWNKIATEFLLNPKFYYDKEQKKRNLVYKNFTQSIKFIVEKMNDNMVMIANNYNLRKSEYTGQRNFIIAIIAFIIGIVGLSITLYSTFFTPKVNAVIINKTIPTKIEKIDNKLNTFSDQIESLISSMDKMVKKIEAYQLLDTIANDISTMKSLIEKDYYSPEDIENEPN